MPFHVPEHYRVTKKDKTIHPTLWSDSTAGNNGFFTFYDFGLKKEVRCLASDGEGWEHVSVSLLNKIPSWEIMNKVKDMFWDSEDCVVQFHPPKSQYVNNHPNCLHLWRKIGYEFPLPETKLIGIK